MINLKWSDYLNPEKKIAINCQTEDEANALLRMLDEKGLKWRDGDALSSNSHYWVYKSDTCYAVNKFGAWYNPWFGYKHDGYTIYKYSNVHFVDDQPDADASDPKAEALEAIACAMACVQDNLQTTKECCDVLSNADAMKTLADAFEVVSRA